MPVTTAFIKEVIRLANVIGLIFPRKMKTDIKLPNGHIMPSKGIRNQLRFAALQ